MGVQLFWQGSKYFGTTLDWKSEYFEIVVPHGGPVISARVQILQRFLDRGVQILRLGELFQRGPCLWQDHENCSLYGVAGCPLFRGCLSIEVNGRTVWTFGIVHYIVGDSLPSSPPISWSFHHHFCMACRLHDVRLSHDTSSVWRTTAIKFLIPSEARLYPGSVKIFRRHRRRQW